MNDRPEDTAISAAPDEPGGYRVLARKYRPALLADLVGQEVMVRTLTNAFASGRLAHAFLLTGVRGIGKTTTARIIARALNCTGPDGQNDKPVAEPCGRCANCVAIAEDRHTDVLEMDAASHTGVDNMRDLIDRVRYGPTMGRTKVYIIDEVHMLSVPAFNALLKTLEEPPPHVKFVFATTEPRRIPVTVLSRCQRFDLRRVDADLLARHLAGIAKSEGAEVDEGALALIARAADGSVRDALSMLDQAIGDAAPEPVREGPVREMLGLADRARLFDLYEAVLGGGLARALDLLGEQYRAGADPVTVLQDLLELSHWLTRVAVTPEAAADPGLPEAERTRGRALAETLGVPELARAWQILLKGLGEVQLAPQPLQAAEMVLVRLAHAANLPTPADLVKRLQAGEPAPAGPAPAPAPAGGASPARAQAAVAEPAPAPAPTPERAAMPDSFEAVVALLAERREMMLSAHLVRDVHLVGFEPGRIEWRPGPGAPARLAAAVGQLLSEWTGRRWVVAVSNEAGAPTLAEQRSAGDARLRSEAEADPLVQSIIETFPGAVIRAVRASPEDGEDEEQRP